MENKHNFNFNEESFYKLVDDSLKDKDYVLKYGAKRAGGLLSVGDCELPDYLIKKKGFIGVIDSFIGNLPAQIYLRECCGVAIVVRDKKILSEMKKIAFGLENMVNEPVKIVEDFPN